MSRTTNKPAPEDQFLSIWREYTHGEAPDPVREHKPCSTRLWRLDFAFVEQQVGIEIDGLKGRHMTVKGKVNDCEKRNWLTVNGWRVLVYTSKDINDRPHEIVQEVLDCVEAASLGGDSLIHF